MAAIDTLVLLVCGAVATLAAIVPRDNSIWDLRMRHAHPTMADAYLCTNYDVEYDEAYIVKFEAMANASTAHHILVYGCEFGPAASDNIWGCPPICKNGPQQIMFAWAKNAPPTQLPDGVGLRIGKKTTIRSIVVQIHYAKSFAANEKPDDSGIRLHLKSEKQPFVAGVFLLMSYNFAVPPETDKFHVDMSCEYKKKYSMFPFAFRTHAHGLGSVITGYQYNDSYHLIGKGNPQWPQAFYPVNGSIEVKPGDKLVARCTFNSTGRGRYTNVGSTGEDEMCNFYIMFYTDAADDRPSDQCGGNMYPDLTMNLPPGNDVTLPPNPLLDEMAHGHHHHAGMTSTATQEAPSVDKAIPPAATSGQHLVATN